MQCNKALKGAKKSANRSRRLKMRAIKCSGGTFWCTLYDVLGNDDYSSLAAAEAAAAAAAAAASVLRM